MSGAPRKRLPIRWLTLGEIVGVAALIIAALGYWDGHREHAEQEKAQQAQAAEAALKQTFLMTGSLNDAADVVRLTTANADQVIQTQTVWFPALVRGSSVETTGNPRLEAHWIEDGLRKAAGKARQGRLPVGIETSYIQDGQTKTDRSIYDLGYSLHPRFLQSDRVQLEGLSLARRGVTGDLQAAADKAGR